MALRVYNTLTRTKQEFQPIVPACVGMYCCGPTVYDHAHIGHAKLYVAMDVVVRYLRFSGFKVKYIQNITDVGHLTDDADAGEDKVARKAAAERVDPMEIVEIYTASFFADMDALKVARPTIAPRASAHIPEQIQIVEDLIAKGCAYEVDGSVYFDVTKDEDYGKLSGRKLDEMEAGARLNVDTNKRHPGDFLLWRKAAAEHILKWPSPWGMGYPGWHLECSAMAKRYLGETFDIHGGGLENMFPHNEDEIAQSEAANGVEFAKYWLHANTLTVGGQKMGKSLGNAIFLKDALGKWSPEAIRFFILSTHYRSVLDVTSESLDAAESGLKKITTTWRTLQEAITKAEDNGDPSLAAQAESIRARFTEAMDDDFNTSAAIACLFDFTRDVNTALSAGTPVGRQALESARDTFQSLGGDVLGILRESAATETSDLAPKLMDILISTRAALRGAKQYQFADDIRNQLTEAGVELEDRPGETIWREKQ